MNRIVPGAMAIVLSDDKTEILLHLRSDNNLWSVPGGSAEFGEDLQTLVKRETLEEAGIEVKIESLIGVYSDPIEFLFEYPDGNRAHSFVVAIMCSMIRGDFKPTAEDSVEARWFKLDNLPANLMPMQTQVIKDALDPHITRPVIR